jgi:hypothetical protein
MQKIMEIDSSRKCSLKACVQQSQPENENPESVPFASMYGLKKYIEQINISHLNIYF